eukprot:SAG11_NODE_9450_length_910_cov_1.505549_1_plen_106_part_00
MDPNCEFGQSRWHASGFAGQKRGALDEQSTVSSLGGRPSFSHFFLRQLAKLNSIPARGTLLEQLDTGTVLTATKHVTAGADFITRPALTRLTTNRVLDVRIAKSC